MRKHIEGIGCYLSCMILFNLIYFLLILSKSNACIEGLKRVNKSFFCALLISGILFLIGVLYTVYITKLDDTERNEATIGKSVEVTSVLDKTSDNYFTNFSVIVLTGVALPLPTDWFLFTVYILIELAIGIVYIKKKQYFINPVLSLLSYNIYECTLKDETTKKELKESIIFITKDVEICKGSKIKYKNSNSEIIWLKE